MPQKINKKHGVRKAFVKNIFHNFMNIESTIQNLQQVLYTKLSSIPMIFAVYMLYSRYPEIWQTFTASV